MNLIIPLWGAINIEFDKPPVHKHTHTHTAVWIAKNVDVTYVPCRHEKSSRWLNYLIENTLSFYNDESSLQ